MSIKAVDMVLDQICVAFGQGTGPLEVSGAAAAALRGYYAVVITEEVAAQWDGVGTQALERVRTAGRLAAQIVTARAGATLQLEEALHAAHTVSRMSATPICPKELPVTLAPAGSEPMGISTVLTQLFIGFGQGTGPVRVSRAGAAALRGHYEERPDVLGTAGPIAPHVLERIRAIGRMSSRLATGRGATAVGGEDVETALATVERTVAPAAAEREEAPEPAEVLAGTR